MSFEQDKKKCNEKEMQHPLLITCGGLALHGARELLILLAEWDSIEFQK